MVFWIFDRVETTSLAHVNIKGTWKSRIGQRLVESKSIPSFFESTVDGGSHVLIKQGKNCELAAEGTTLKDFSGLCCCGTWAAGGDNKAIDVQKFRCSTSMGRFCIRSSVATQLSERTDPTFVRKERRNYNCVVPDHMSINRLVRGRGGWDVQECLYKVNASGVPHGVVLGPPISMAKHFENMLPRRWDESNEICVVVDGGECLCF